MRALLLLALLVPAAGAAEAPGDHALERIEAAIKKAGPRHPWAGTYYLGDGLGTNETLLLSPAGEYYFESSGCTSFPPPQRGKFREDAGVLRFEGAEGEDMTGRTYHVVPWGKRVYLLSEGGLISFANDYNQGLEPRWEGHGFNFLRRDGGEIPLASGRPRVPKDVEPYLLDRAVDVSVVTAGASVVIATESVRKGSLETTIEVDAGKEAGLLPGMELKVRGDLDGDATISRVDARTSTAVLVSTVPPRAGWRLSTRYDWRRELAPPDQPYRIRVVRSAGAGLAPYKGDVEALDELVPLETAPRFGFKVTEVARIEVGAVSSRLSSRSKIKEALRPLGGNAFVRERGGGDDEPGPWSHVDKAVGYRIEFEGRPVPGDDFATNLHGDGYDKTWERTRARILLKRSKYAREEDRLENEAARDLLHLTKRQWSDSYTLKMDELTPEQRAAVKEKTGVTYAYVRLWDVLHSSLSHWSRTLRAEVRARLRARGKNDPQGIAEYEALRAVAFPPDEDD